MLNKVLLFMLVFISGCGLIDNDNSANYEDTKRIMLRPALSPKQDEGLALYMWTEEYYAHGGFTLENYPKLDGRMLDIYISGVKSPPADGVYTMALAPAFGSVSLASLSGEYKMIIRSKDFSDEYKLIVEKDYARIEGDSTRHTKPYPFQY